jgi:hypothetical protein
MYPEWAEHIALDGMRIYLVEEGKSKYVNTDPEDVKKEINEYKDNSAAYNDNRTKWLRSLQKGWEDILLE